MRESGRGENPEATFKMPNRMSKPESHRRADTRGGVPRRISAEAGIVKTPDALVPASALETRTTLEAKPAVVETVARIETPKPPEQPPTPAEAPEAEPIQTIDMDDVPDAEPVPVTQQERAKYVTAAGLSKAGLNVGKGGLYSVFALSYFGYEASKPVARGALRLLDWLGRKMDTLADKMIDKKMPLLKYLINPTVSLLDNAAKWFGLDKALSEHIKNNDKARKDLAGKLLTELRTTQTAAERKADDAAKKLKRQEKIQKAFGNDAAALLVEEIKNIETSEQKSE